MSLNVQMAVAAVAVVLFTVICYGVGFLTKRGDMYRSAVKTKNALDEFRFAAFYALCCVSGMLCIAGIAASAWKYVAFPIDAAIGGISILSGVVFYFVFRFMIKAVSA